MAKWTKRILISLGILIVLLLGAAILIPILFKDRIEAAVKAEVNKNLNAVVDWGDWDLTLLKNFPNLTVEVENVKVSNVAPFEGIDLARIGTFTATVDIKSLFRDRIDIKRIGLVRPHIHVKVLEDGRANWDIAKAAAVSSEAQKAFAADPDIRAVTSLGRVVDQMSGQDAGQRAHLLRLIDEGAVDFNSRLVNPGARAIAVTAFLDDVDSQHLVERQGAWNAIVARLRAAHPEADFELTGLSLVAANGGTEMISALKRSLVGAICVIFTLIAAWLGSLRLGLVSLPPNIAPIAIASAPIYLSETGIQFSVIIAFTVGFGIAVDDTIHFLNRYRDRGAGASVHDRITDAVHAVGVPMIVSSLVLLTGISVTLLSQLPMVRLFGQISMLVVASALAADLLFLPALLNLRRRGAGDPASDNSEKTT